MAHHSKNGNFIKGNQHQGPQKKIMAQVVFYFGLISLLISVLYIILNRTEADTIMNSWLPFMIAGVILIVISQVIKSTGVPGKNLNRKKKQHS